MELYALWAPPVLQTLPSPQQLRPLSELKTRPRLVRLGLEGRARTQLTPLPPRRIRAVPLRRFRKAPTPFILPSLPPPQIPQADRQPLVSIPRSLLTQSLQELVVLAPQELASLRVVIQPKPIRHSETLHLLPLMGQSVQVARLLSPLAAH